MFTGVGSRNRRFHMSTAWRADRDHVDLGIGQHIIQIGISYSLKLRSKPLGRLNPIIKTRDKFRPANLLNRLGVKMRYHSTTDDSKTYCHNFSLT